MADKEFVTADLYIAAFLLSCDDIEFKGLTEQRQRDRVDFVFTPLDLCQKFVAKYISGSINVSAKRYADSIKTIKDMVFEKKREKER